MSRGESERFHWVRVDAYDSLSLNYGPSLSKDYSLSKNHLTQKIVSKLAPVMLATEKCHRLVAVIRHQRRYTTFRFWS